MIKLIRILFFLLAIVIALATCGSYFSSYVEPDKLRTLVLIQYGFPYIWLLNIVVIILYLIFGRSWRMAIPVVAAVVTFGGARSVFAISGDAEISADKTSIKVLTYNVHYMSLTKPDSIGQFIEAQDADIVCMQEADANTQKKLSKWLGAYPYISVHKIKKPSAMSGDKQLLLSKYPLSVKELGGESELYLQCVEVAIEDKKLSIFNCHLASIGLVKDQIQMFDPSQLAQLPEQDKSNVKKQLSTTRSKMTDAYHRRQEQVQTIIKLIDTIKTPLLICGDFNDTPISYTYQMVRKQGMEDSFIDAGKGLGNTYNGELPPIRIDYIWHTKELKSVRYKELRVPYSDHFPVSATIEFQD